MLSLARTAAQARCYGDLAGAAMVLTGRAEASAQGAEEAEFRVALNVGHEARPLARVASGGELARVMLALKTILAGLDHVPTLIFDEVDAGIGGAVALMVADAMKRVESGLKLITAVYLRREVGIRVRGVLGLGGRGLPSRAGSRGTAPARHR